MACDRSSSGHDGHDARRPWPPAVLTDSSGWQMSFGERAALEGLLAACRPGLALEIGTAEGGSLSALAAHSDEVHAIDLAEPKLDPPANVEVHVGDSKAVLPGLLERLASGGRNVDYVLVDGDHSAAGVRADLENLLCSPAVAETLIVCHDTMNEEVRSGIESVDFAAHPKVRYVELDFVAGYMGRQDPFEGQLWGGLGIVVVDAASDPGIPGGVDGDPRYYDAHTMLRKRGGVRPLRALRRLLASRRSSG